jgi:hypothetical protein
LRVSAIISDVSQKWGKVRFKITEVFGAAFFEKAAKKPPFL